MHLLFISFFAGILTVLAPCVVVVLPLILGRSTAETNKPSRRPFVIIASLITSVFIFSLLLKSSTLLISVPQSYWQILSGVIILLFGIVSLFPGLWERVSGVLKLQQKAQVGSSAAFKQSGIKGDILLGASLGPIFSACSPTYALIIAGILPVSFVRGIVYLLAFLAGLGGTLLLIALLGQTFIKKMRWSINPNGVFKKGLAILFILLGLAIITGYDKKIEAYLVTNGIFDWQVSLESRLQQ